MSARQMLRDLKGDGLFENEIADMLQVTEITIRNWRLGTEPQAEKRQRLIDLHKARRLPAGSRK